MLSTAPQSLSFAGTRSEATVQLVVLTPLEPILESARAAALAQVFWDAGIMGTFIALTLFLLLWAERRQSALEARLAERESLAMSISEIGTWEIDLDANRLYLSPGSREIRGLDRQTSSMPVKDLARMLHPDEDPGRLDLMLRTPLGGSFSMDFRIVRDDGSIRWIESRGQRGGDGLESNTIIGTDVDITKRKLTESALDRALRQLQIVAEEAPVMIAQCSADKRYIFVNQPYADLFGRNADDIPGLLIREVLGPEAFAEAEPHIDSALTGNAVAYELEIPALAGGFRSLLVRYAPERDNNGVVFGFIAAVTDISELKRAETARESSEHQYRELWNTSGDALMLLNGADLAIATSNLTFKRLFDIPEDAGPLARTLLDLSPEYQPGLASRWCAVMPNRSAAPPGSGAPRARALP